MEKLSATQFAIATGISRRTVARMLARGEIDGAELLAGAIWQIPRRMVARFQSEKHKPRRGRPRKNPKD